MDLHSNKMGNTSELIKLQSGSVFFFLIALSTFSLFDVQLIEPASVDYFPATIQNSSAPNIYFFRGFNPKINFLQGVAFPVSNYSNQIFFESLKNDSNSKI